MQADILRAATPDRPVTTNLRPRAIVSTTSTAEVIDFVSIESTAALKSKSAELACEIDISAR